MKAIRTAIANYWLTTVYAVISFVVVDQVLAYRLSTLLSGASLRELSTINSDLHFSVFLKNPSFSIYKLPLSFLNALDKVTVYHARLLSTVFALLTVTAIYYVLRRWQGVQTAIIGSFLLATSSWFLTYSRMATPDILYPFLISLALVYGTWARRSKHAGRILFLGMLLGIAFVYTPGLIWFVIPAIIWQHKSLSRQLFEAPTAGIITMATAIVLVLPLGYSIFRQPDIVNQLLGLPSNLSNIWGSFYQNTQAAFRILVLHGQSDATLGLIGVSVLDLFTGTMALMGAFELLKDHKLDRSRMIIGCLVITLMLVALTGLDKLPILLPLIYTLAGLGIAHMMTSWMSVFPRNPLARYVGVGIICTLVLLTSYYHLSRYFVAWPHSPETVHALRPLMLK